MAASKHRENARALVDRSSNPKNDLRFWKVKKPHEAIFSQWNRIGHRTRARRSQDLYFACLYDDAELAAAMHGVGAIGEFTPQTLATNICRRQVDTYVSRIGKNRPVPMALTKGGNYSQQRRAKSISQFFEGVLDEVDYWPTRNLRLRDGGIFGSGLALNWREGRTLHHDRIYPWECRVDPRDALYGKPRTMLIGRFVDKLVLKERYPEFEEEIDKADAKTTEDNWEIGWDETCDLAFTISAYHLPSGEDMKDPDGAMCVAVSTATLQHDEYLRPKFPVSKFDYSPPVIGWWGEGLIKQLAGLQYEVNSVGLRLQEANYLMGSYWLREENAGVEFEHIDNGCGTEVVYSGTPPQYVAPAAAHPQLFEWFRTLRTQMPSEVTGISGMATRSEKPPGLDSGKAINAWHDIDDENLIDQGRRDEQDSIETSWQLFDLTEEIYEEGKLPPKKGEKKREPYVINIEVRSHGKSVLADIDYGKVRLDKKEFKLRTFPTNFLRGTPEEQMQAVADMIKSGFLGQDEALVLLDFPDLQHVLNLRTASRHVIEKILEKVRDSKNPEKDYVYPEPAMGLKLCQALGLMTYLEAWQDGVEEDNLRWLLQFSIDAADQLTGNQPIDTTGNSVEEEPPMEEMPPDAGMAPMPGGDLYAPPEAPLLPEGAVPPEAIPTMAGPPG